MRTMDRLQALLPKETAARMEELGDRLWEVRLRAGHPVHLRHARGSAMAETPLSAEAVSAIAASLMDHSFYAREAELRQGFFTMPDGCRVGVCGRMNCVEGHSGGIAAIASMCVRAAREIRGCADEFLNYALDESDGLRSMLLLSRPGMGKTTLLRDLARQLSEAGYCVAISDERHELAACVQGVPTLDVGPCTDVMDGLPKAEAMFYLLRAMSPDVIVTDEIGTPEDAQAIAEVSRCGVAVIASAHAGNLAAARRRTGLADILRDGCFDVAVEIGDSPGHIRSVQPLKCGEGGHAIRAGDVRGHRLYALRKIAGAQRSQAG